MKIGIIGSGVVAQTLGAKLCELGHDVAIGTRDPQKLDDKKNFTGSLREWLGKVGGKGKVVTFRDAASFGELLINASSGDISDEEPKMAGDGRVGAKVLIDTANLLDHSQGMPPRALASQDNCLAEQIQTAFPNLKVVKCFNTIGAPVMVNPRALKDGDHTIFLSGNDGGAKSVVSELL